MSPSGEAAVASWWLRGPSGDVPITAANFGGAERVVQLRDQVELSVFR